MIPNENERELTAKKMLRVGGGELFEVCELDSGLSKEKLSLGTSGGVENFYRVIFEVSERRSFQERNEELTLHNIVGVRVNEH